MLKYQNAFDKNDNVVHISSINGARKQTLGPFRCIGCNSELVPALGDIREHHFKHKSQTHCSPETYLHKAAKLAVFTGLKKASEENGEYWVFAKQAVHCPKGFRKGACGNCGQQPSKLNLAKLINSVSLEKKAKGFIADVLAEDTHNGLQIAIEICVNNPCSAEKISSGLRIIETQVSNEVDVQRLYSGIPISSKDYNLPNIDDKTADHCLLSQVESSQNSEVMSKRSLILYDDGRLFILNEPFTAAFRASIVGQNFAYCTQSGSASFKTMRKVLGAWGVTKAFVDEKMVRNVIRNVGRQNVRSCVTCEHFEKHGPNVLENITCRKRGAKPQFEALQCDLFDPK